MNVLILHGIHGSAGKHWMQWLHDELVKLGHKVVMPTLPNSEDPSYIEWRDAILNLLEGIDGEQLVIVGHSMGVPIALDCMGLQNKSILGFISVAGFAADYGSELNTKFMKDVRVDLAKVQELIKYKVVIYSDDDPYVPLEELAALAKGLETEPIVIPKGGHFNTSAGYTEFPLLLSFFERFKGA